MLGHTGTGSRASVGGGKGDPVSFMKKHWLKSPSADAFVKRLVIFIGTIALWGALLALASFLAEWQLEDTGSVTRKSMKFMFIVIIGGVISIVWTFLRLLVDPIRCAITGRHLGEPKPVLAPPAPVAGHAQVPSVAQAQGSGLGAYVAAVNAQTPPELAARMRVKEPALFGATSDQAAQMSIWLRRAAPSPTARYNGSSPVGVLPTKELVQEVYRFTNAHCRPPLPTAPAGSDEALLGQWLQQLWVAKTTGALEGEQKKAVRGLRFWSGTWQLAFTLE